MANTISNISLANTFGDLVSTTVQTVNELNYIGNQDWHKPSGTIYLDSTGIALDISNEAIFRGQVTITGIGSSLTVHKNENVQGVLYLTNTDTDANPNKLILSANGVANVNYLNITGTGQSANISNNMYIGGTLSIAGNTSTSSDLIVSKDITTNNQTIIHNLNVGENATIGNDLTVGNNLNVPYTLTAGSGLFDNISVLGNFTISGQTVYDSNIFTLNASESINTSAYFSNYRPGGANAHIRWNESSKWWDLRDVENPTYYSRILTANDYVSINSDSKLYTDSQITANAISANAVITTANTNLKLYVDSQITANAISANAVITTANTNLKLYVDTTKVSSVSGTSGRISSTGGLTPVLDLVASGVTVGTYGGSVTIPTINVDTYGRVTSISNNSILLPISSGGTGATSQSQALTNLLPTGTTAGYVLTTGGPGNFYWAAAGTGGGSTPGTTINTTRLSYTATAGQTVFTAPTYVPGTGQLRVYINGVRQFPSEYTETNATTVTLTTGANLNDVVFVEVDGYINNPYYANNITFTAPFGGIVASANTIQLAIQDLESRKATLASPTFTGLPTAPTPPASTSNTVIATTAYVQTANSNMRTYVDGAIASSNNAMKVYVDGNFVFNSSNAVLNSLGVGTSPSGVSGEIRATNNITAYYSDERLKTNLGNIPNALEKVNSLNGFYHEANELAQSLGYEKVREVGVSAQEVQSVLPEVVAPAPIDDKYLTVRYERLVPLLIEAIKELNEKVEQLQQQIDNTR